jgi:hypothetical protein
MEDLDGAGIMTILGDDVWKGVWLKSDPALVLKLWSPRYSKGMGRCWKRLKQKRESGSHRKIQE